MANLVSLQGAWLWNPQDMQPGWCSGPLKPKMLCAGDMGLQTVRTLMLLLVALHSGIISAQDLPSQVQLFETKAVST